jgi:uncharacterized lipoprotein YddW (UPF0748 family)
MLQRLLCGVLAGLTSFGVFTLNAQSQSRLDRLLRTKTTMGVWLTNSPSPLYYDRRRMAVAMDELQRAGFTRVIPNVWSRGTTFHRSRFAPVEPPLAKVGLGIDPICTLAAEGRKRWHQGDALV